MDYCLKVPKHLNMNFKFLGVPIIVAYMVLLKIFFFSQNKLTSSKSWMFRIVSV